MWQTVTADDVYRTTAKREHCAKSNVGASDAHGWLCDMKQRAIAWEKSIRHENHKQIFYVACLLPLLQTCLPLAIFPVSLAPTLGSRSNP